MRKRARRIVAVVAVWVCGAAGGARAADDVAARAQALATQYPLLIDSSTIGTSRRGTPIVALRVTNRGAPADDGPPPPAPEDRPALVVIAGLDGRHLVGTDVALGLAEDLAKNHASPLLRAAVYIVPCLNPDARAWTLDGGHAKMDFGRAQSSMDADHDRRASEDGAEDLNGDGIVTMMRVRDPSPGSGLRPEYVIDADNASIVRRPDPAKGERASVALLPEGSDNDGDGRYNEDGVGGSAGGGVDLDRNFPYRWPEFIDGAGPFPLSEPETRALTDWLLRTKDVVAVVVYGPGDSIVALPEAGKFEPDGATPTGIENDDKAQFDEIARLFKEATSIAEATPAERPGSLHGWAYAHLAVYSMNTPVWVRTDQVKKPEPKKDEKKEEAPAAAPPSTPETTPPPPAPRPIALDDEQRAEAGLASHGLEEEAQPPGQPPGGGRGGFRRGGGPGGGPPGAPGGPAQGGDKKQGDDAKWLAYDQERVKAGDPSGFVAWTPFVHPQLGAVEVGGFVPGFRLNPPAAELPRLVGEQSKFVVGLVGRFPRVVVSEKRVERLGPGLWRVWVRAVNQGAMPSLSAIAVKARRHLPTIVRLDVPMDRIVSGERVYRSWSIAGGGGTADSEWTIRGEAGSEVSVEVVPSVGAKAVVKLMLEEAAR